MSLSTADTDADSIYSFFFSIFVQLMAHIQQIFYLLFWPAWISHLIKYIKKHFLQPLEELLGLKIYRGTFFLNSVRWL